MDSYSVYNVITHFTLTASDIHLIGTLVRKDCVLVNLRAELDTTAISTYFFILKSSWPQLDAIITTTLCSSRSMLEQSAKKTFHYSIRRRVKRLRNVQQSQLNNARKSYRLRDIRIVRVTSAISSGCNSIQHFSYRELD